MQNWKKTKSFSKLPDFSLLEGITSEELEQRDREIELARRAEITPQNLSNKFSRNKFSNEDLEKIAAALNSHLEIKFIDNATGQPII